MHEKELNLPIDVKYSADHQWIKMTDDITGICGVTEFIHIILGEIIFVEFINNILHRDIMNGEKIAIMESLKDSLDIYAILPGKIIEINRSLEDNPELIYNDCYEEGWIYKIELEDVTLLEDLLEPDDYIEVISQNDI